MQFVTPMHTKHVVKFYDVPLIHENVNALCRRKTMNIIYASFNKTNVDKFITQYS